MVKSILKRYSRPATSRPENNTYTPEGVDSPKKRVSFDGPELVRVFEADEWDRTPAQVTLKLTYKDVAELRELNISLIRPGPLAMERTKSRRPTPRSAAPQLSPLNMSVQPNVSTYHTPVVRPSSPIPPRPTLSLSSPAPRTLPTLQLPVLLEDQHPTPTVASTTVDDNTDHYDSEGDSLSLTRSPPGLSVRTPTQNSLASPASTLPSSLHLSLPTSRPTGPKPYPMESPAPLYRPPHLRARFANPLFKSSVAPGLEKLVIDPEAHGNTLMSPNMRASELVSLGSKAASVSLVLNREGDKNSLSATSLSLPTPPLSRKPSRSLMGWELRRNSQLGFGLVRKHLVNNDPPK